MTNFGTHDRSYSLIDRICLKLDQWIRQPSNSHNSDNPNDKTQRSNTNYPAANIPEASLNAAEKSKVARMMRVNHSGEICAQGLYYGQSILVRSKTLALHLKKAAEEEGNHLTWCAQRLSELKSHTSYLNPLWMIGSIGIGFFAGLRGDAFSLGFIAETERQVSKHLQRHLNDLPLNDRRSHTILETMQDEEKQHCAQALAAGGKIQLPTCIRAGMRVSSKVMVTLAYWI